MSPNAEMTMLLGSLPGNAESHPGKLLTRHLHEVAKLSALLSEYNRTGVSEEKLEAVSLTHDIAKAQKEFQKYLYKQGQGVNHALLSGWFTYLISSDFWLGELVSRHHTHLRNYDVIGMGKVVSCWFPDKSMANVITGKIKEIVPAWQKDDILMMVSKLDETLFDLDPSNIDEHLWLELRMIYSLLVAADRMEAVGDRPMGQIMIPPFRDTYSSNAPALVNQWRQEVQELCLRECEKISEPGVYTLTLPTGAGKTITGVKAAVSLAKRFGNNKLIYALPYISIVEQTAAVASDNFGAAYIQEDHSLYFMKRENTSEREDGPTETNKMANLFRYWQQPVVMTTMVQLWDAIFSPYANRTMNFHRLSDSVIIIDEPQSISPCYWKGFGRVLQYLSQKLGCTFLLMTATQPVMGGKAELCPVRAKYPINRHNYTFIKGSVQVDELQDFIQSTVSQVEAPGMIIMNTKKSALEAYRALQCILECEEVPVLFLSTWLAPVHRAEVLRRLKQLEIENQKRYLVSTQVVEAGVDIDFSWVIRDLAPLDNIIQAAGRCNRHGKMNIPQNGIASGQVIIFECKKDNRSLGSYVYNPVFLDRTRKTLNQYPAFSEEDTSHILEQYYINILDGIESVDIMRDFIQKGRWESIPRLIEEQKYYEAILVIELDDRVMDIVDQLENTQWSLDNHEVRKDLMRELMLYSISVPCKLIESARIKASLYEYDTQDGKPALRKVLNGSMWLIKKEACGIEKIYDPILGFVPSEVENDIEWRQI